MVTSPPYACKDYDAEGSFQDYLGMLARVMAEVHRVLEAQALIADWRQEYNGYRPPSALGMLPPAELARQWRTNQPQLHSGCTDHWVRSVPPGQARPRWRYGNYGGRHARGRGSGTSGRLLYTCTAAAIITCAYRRLAGRGPCGFVIDPVQRSRIMGGGDRPPERPCQPG